MGNTLCNLSARATYKPDLHKAIPGHLSPYATYNSWKVTHAYSITVAKIVQS